MSENFDGVRVNERGEDVAADGTVSMLMGGRDRITIRPLSDREIAQTIQRTHPDGSEWKIVYDDPNHPSAYFLVARSHGYFGTNIEAVLVSLSQFIGWQNGVLPLPPKPRSDHLFDNKAGAFAYLHTLTPSIEAAFNRERRLSLPSSARTTADVGMKRLSERANPFR